MYELDRRTFLKLIGQGTAVLGMGLSGSSPVKTRSAWAAQSGGVPTQKQAKTAVPNWNEWEFYYPGKYNNAEDAKGLSEIQAQVAQINKRGDINVKDLISGKLAGTPGVRRLEDTGEEGLKEFQAEAKVTFEEMMEFTKIYGAHNPLFTDREYAKKTKYGDLIAMPVMFNPGGWPSVSGIKGFGDYMVVSDLNVSCTFHSPVYEGDSTYSVIDRQDCVDITPSLGSYYRTFAISGTGRFFNQKGELVAEGSHIVKESFRRHKDPAKRNPDGVRAWESPDWWSRPPHMYTDEDWEYIKSIWRNEKIRGAEVLYWDDVNIGDEPPPRAVGPIISEVETSMLGLGIDPPQWSIDTKLNVLDPKTFAKMVKNKQGIYVLPQYLEKKPAESGPADSNATPEIANRDDRALLQNSVAAKWAAGMILNWIGDEGWLQRFGWDIMSRPMGYAKDISYDENPSVIPWLNKDMMPELFDKYPFMDKVPYMRGCRAAWHPMEGDINIFRSYVTDKYQKGNEYFVDLTWWCQSIDKYIVEEGYATVKLPKK